MTDASDNAVELDEAEVLVGEGGEVVEDDGFGGVIVCAGRVGVGAEGHDVLEFDQRVRVPFPLGVEERTRGVLAVTLAYIGVGAGTGRPRCSLSDKAIACPSLSKLILHAGGEGSKFLVERQARSSACLLPGRAIDSERLTKVPQPCPLTRTRLPRTPSEGTARLHLVHCGEEERISLLLHGEGFRREHGKDARWTGADDEDRGLGGCCAHGW